jgi:hypothetical protein
VTDQIPAEATPDWYAAELAAGDGVCRHPTCDCKAAVAYRAGRAAERERIAAALEAEAASGRKLGLTRISLRVVAGRLRDGKPIPAPQNDDGERCNCRCKNPKGQCGCCDESLSGWYAEQDAP